MANDKDQDNRQPAAPRDPAEQIVQWVQARQKQVSVAGVVVVVVALGAWYMWAWNARKEAAASTQLQAARVSVDAGNLQLAATDLDQLVNQFAGTIASEEATVLLARVHILQGENDLAISELRTFLGAGPNAQFEAPGYGLLGSALENVGQYGEAADAFRQAADASSEYELIRAELLLDVGRAATLAGDTTRAAAAYREILDIEMDTPAKIQARLRLGELDRAS